MTSKKGFILAIDGPVASGKGTIAPALAKKIHGLYLSSGAVFRCVGLVCLEKNIDTKSESAVDTVLKDIHIDITKNEVMLNGNDVAQEIKMQSIAMAASDVGVFKNVRQLMVAIMRRSANILVQQGLNVVTEGRDMGTRAFPNAALKVFLTAQPEIRAKRRLEQIKANQTERVPSFKQILEDTLKRDNQDTHRALDPLVSDPEKYGYKIVDSSNLTEEQTVHVIMAELKKKQLV
jgi:CMP/dCMP kinase